MKIYKKLNHFAVQLKLMQHCKSTIFQLKKKLGKKKAKKIPGNKQQDGLLKANHTQKKTV